MSWQERQYHREGPSLSDRFSGASVVMWLLVINGAVFLIDSILDGSTRGGWLSLGYWGHFSVGRGVLRLQLWRWVTYQFLHHNALHLVFNMMGLYFFGPVMERWWGSRRFLAFYLLCGFAAAGVYSLLSLVPGLLNVSSATGLVGASGAIFGILIGCATLYPQQRVMLLIPPVPMKLRTMAMLILGLALFSLIAGSPNAGGEAAHLGGAALGWLLVRYPGWLGFVEGDLLSAWKQQRHRRTLNKEDAEVDRILDKVRRHGLASLNKREKKTLQRATDRQRHAG